MRGRSPCSIAEDWLARYSGAYTKRAAKVLTSLEALATSVNAGIDIVMV